MSKLKTLWMALLLSNQVANGTPNVTHIPADSLEWKKTEIVMPNNQIWITSDAIYETLQE